MKKGTIEQCEGGQTLKEEYRNSASQCRDANRRAKLSWSSE